MVVAPIERVLAHSRDRRSASADIASRVGLSIDLGLLQPLERLPRDHELATAFGVADTTVRTHVNRLFEKTGVTRQADLVKLVAGYATMVAE